MLETFVEQERFRGTAYQAANWLCLGQTTGRIRSMRRQLHGDRVQQTGAIGGPD